MERTEILEVLDKYQSKPKNSHQSLIWDQATGSTVYSNDKPYIDFTSGIFVTNAGHSSISKHVMAQAQKDMVYSYTYPTEIKALFIKKLMEMVPRYFQKVVLATTGGEAVEIAAKLLRLAHIKRSPSKTSRTIVSIKGSMHGKTYLGEKLKGTAEWVGGNDAEFYRISKFPDKDSNFLGDMAEFLDENKGDNIAGFLLESYRGWDGRFLPTDYVHQIFTFAKPRNIPICFDEIQGGFWRTGTMFSYEHYGVEPDLITVGKGLGGVIPISAVLGRADLIDCCDDLTATFSGNPLSCAAALGNLSNLQEISKEDLYARSNFLKQSLQGFVDKYKLVKGVHSKGLLGAIIFEEVSTADKCYQMALLEGLLLVQTGKKSIKIGPPLVIALKDLMKGLRILEKVLLILDEPKKVNPFPSQRYD